MTTLPSSAHSGASPGARSRAADAAPANAVEAGLDALPLNLHLQQLAYVRALERWGTLTEAARRLQVSQPALSQSLSQLERRLG
ncbi:MAG: LysR family transcriptional regulator, partial [Chloroflexi bacterium]|nr:LysR family transcriptional regulator [Chloroflexota bacterium]